MKDLCLPLKSMPLVLGADGVIPEWVQLCPRGLVHSTKGDFVVDEDGFRLVQDAFKAIAHDLVMDYEHQTLGGDYAAPDGKAPAAGWIQELQLRDDGLYGRMSWTERGAGLVAAREYRYVSPVVRVRRGDRRVVEIHSAGLTNDPAIRGGKPIANTAGQDTEGNGMDVVKNKAIELLSLKAEATDDEIVAALTDLKGLRDEAVAVLELKAGTASELKATVLALKAKGQGPSQAEYQALKDRLDARDADDLVEQGINGRKISPAQRDWAKQYALSDKAGFQTFLDKAPVVVPAGRMADGKPAAGGEAELSAADLAACNQVGLTPEQFKAARKAELEEVA